MALALPSSPHTAIFRAAVHILRTNATLRSVVRTWRVWDGDRTDLHPIAVNMCPAISLLPSEGPDSFYGPSGFRGNLNVTLALAVGGTNADDLLNLYHAVRRAFYPGDPTARVAVRKALLAAGCLNEDQPTFTQSALGIQVDEDSAAMLIARGQMLFQPRVIDP